MDGMVRPAVFSESADMDVDRPVDTEVDEEYALEMIALGCRLEKVGEGVA